ncbi:hypothetical protein ZWY2020_009032 [Hordeum vulgare]|nr:hypothetical protein ZWY2020_009032 [Hordeum vulgare]
MSGFGDGYVGTAQDAVKIRRLEKQRQAEHRKIEELNSKNADGQPGLLQFGSSTSEILETAFKKETVGLVTREQYLRSLFLYTRNSESLSLKTELVSILGMTLTIA